MKEYASKEILEWRKKEQEKAIAPIRTSEFLIQNSSMFFWGTPDEIKYKPNYYISDDDRLYWWDGSDEVIISEKTDKWINKLVSMHKEIMENEDLSEISSNFIKYFIDIIYEADEYYKRILPFQSMFYEFIENSSKKEYMAALKLFSNLANSEQYKKDGEIIKHLGSWFVTSRNVTHNQARIKLKRYLGLMANVKLRKKYFGF